MEAINARLESEGLTQLRVVLVTRVMSLYRATILKSEKFGIRPAQFLRHPRMLLMPGLDERLPAETVKSLAIALDTFQRQLDEPPQDAQQPAEHSKLARKYFVEAWHSFEKAEFALDFADKPCTCCRSRSSV